MLALVALPALAACSNDGTPSNSPSIDGNAQVRAAAADMVQCLRANGFPNMPDVTIDGRGQPQAPPGMDPGANEQVRAALEGPCRPQLDRVNALIGEQEQQQRRQEEQRPVLSAEDQGKLRTYAQCIREHGLPDWPDADPTGRFVLPKSWPEGLGKGDRPMDRTFLSALEACKSLAVPESSIG